MPTQEMPDNELDDLFRKAAGESNAEFEPEAWKRMEQLLDERDGRTGGYWWKGILFVLILLLVGTLGVVLLRKPGSTPTGQITDNQQSGTVTIPAGSNESAGRNAEPERVPAAPDNTAGENTPAGNATNANAANHATGDSKAQAVHGQTAGAKTITGGRESAGSAQKEASRTVTREGEDEKGAADGLPTGVGNRENATNQPTPGTAKRVAARVRQAPNPLRPGAINGQGKGLPSRGKRPNRMATHSRNESPGTAGGAGKRSQIRKLAGEGADRTDVTPAPRLDADSEDAMLPAVVRLPELAFLTGKSLVAAPSDPGRGSVPPPAAREKRPIEPTAKPKGPTARLSIGVMVSPDLSSIGLSGRLTPGTNAGLQLEYRLTNRFRVGVGAVHSVKLYSAEVEDYTVPYGFWTYGVKPSGIDANCKILDLPVHLRFDALRRSRYNAFVSTGLSSYIMLSERYGYHYPTYDPYLRPEWYGKRTGEHYFSVVNLSVGYERNLGRRFSWQVEPFLKLPLGGVGFGKVRLGSSGAFVALKYKIGKSTNQ